MGIRNTRWFVFGVGLLWQSVSAMLPPIAGIPLLLAGLVVIAWAIWPIRIQNFLRSWPAPVQTAFFAFLSKIESTVDNTRTAFVHGEVDTRGEAGAGETYVKFRPAEPVGIEASSNVSSITEHGVGDFEVNFAHQINEEYFVQLLTDGDVASEIISRAPDGFRIRIKGDEPERLALKVVFV